MSKPGPNPPIERTDESSRAFVCRSCRTLGVMPNERRCYLGRPLGIRHRLRHSDFVRCSSSCHSASTRTYRSADRYRHRCSGLCSKSRCKFDRARLPLLPPTNRRTRDRSPVHARCWSCPLASQGTLTMTPNPSIEPTPYSKLRLLPVAAHVKRSAARGSGVASSVT